MTEKWCTAASNASDSKLEARVAEHEARLRRALDLIVGLS